MCSTAGIAAYQSRVGMTGQTVTCLLCPHNCRIAAGGHGICRVRVNQGGVLRPLFVDQAAAIALDPIEKKPLRRFMPGTMTYSIGFPGCNLACSFCQNAHLSCADMPRGVPLPARWQDLVFDSTPQQRIEQALRSGAPSISYTYSEPLVSFEAVLATAQLARRAGLANILVTNGYIQSAPMRELLPWIDAMNIDLKAFDDAAYQTWCGGRLQPVLDTITLCQDACHIEVTTLVVPGMNDQMVELTALFDWLAALDHTIPLHLSRCFPANRHVAPPISRADLFHIVAAAQKRLEYVYAGNV